MNGTKMTRGIANHSLTQSFAMPIALGMAYFTLASLTILWTRFDGGVSNIWIASALLTAQLMRTDVDRWPPMLVACGIASFLATTLFGLGVLAAGPLVVANIGESLIGASLLRRFGRGADYLDTLSSVGLFAACAGVTAPLITAPLAATVAHASIAMPVLTLARGWLAGHALGMLVCAPMISLMLSRELFAGLRDAWTTRPVEGGMLILAMAGVSLLTFGQEHFPLLFLPMLPLVIMTFRLDRIGAVLGVVILVIIGGALTVAGHGPVTLFRTVVADRAFFLQVYFATTVMTVLPVAAELRQRREIFRRLRESEARYKLITESATDIVLELDIHGVVSYVSPSVREITGFEPEVLIGRRANELLSGPDARTFIAAHRQVRQTPGASTKIEYRGQDASGEAMWFEANTRGIFDDHGTLVGSVSAIRDISRRKSLEMKLAHAASTDPLTGLGNRRAFDTLLDIKLNEVRSGTARGCVAIFDLDFFKRVNDQHGHAIGDRVLESFARTALRIVRSHDYVGRLGGEEFGVILDGADIVQAQRICDRLREAVASDIVRTTTGASVRVTASAGIAVISPAHTREQIMMAADEALYAAKAGGRDRLAIAA